jgi:hypothetical protein
MAGMQSRPWEQKENERWRLGGGEGREITREDGD